MTTRYIFDRKESRDRRQVVEGKRTVGRGRYWTLARQAADTDPQSDAALRAFEEGETRLKIRRAAEATKDEVEFKPCQNVIDYRLAFKISSPKN